MPIGDMINKSYVDNDKDQKINSEWNKNTATASLCQKIGISALFLGISIGGWLYSNRLTYNNAINKPRLRQKYIAKLVEDHKKNFEFKYVTEVEYCCTLDRLLEKYEIAANECKGIKKKFIQSEIPQIKSARDYEHENEFTLCGISKRDFDIFGQYTIKSKIYIFDSAFCLNKEDDIKSTIDHECNHTILDAEGFYFKLKPNNTVPKNIIPVFINCDEAYVLDRQFNSILKGKFNVSKYFFWNTLQYYKENLEMVKILSIRDSYEGDYAISILKQIKNKPEDLEQFYNEKYN